MIIFVRLAKKISFRTVLATVLFVLCVNMYGQIANSSSNTKSGKSQWYQSVLQQANKKKNKTVKNARPKVQNHNKKSVDHSEHVETGNDFNAPFPAYNDDSAQDDITVSNPVPTRSKEEEVPQKPQTEFTDIYQESSSQGLVLEQIEQLDYSTMLYFSYTVPTAEGDLYRCINFNESTFIKANYSDKKYHLVNSLNMPISSEAEFRAMIVEKKEYQHHFVLEFEKIPDDCTFDVIENESKPESFHVKGASWGKWNSREFISAEDYIRDYPVKECGSYIDKGQTIYYVSSNGIILNLGLSQSKNYGKYYSVQLDIQNFSGKSILFSLDNVRAEGHVNYISNSGRLETKTIPMTLLSASEYDRKIQRRQSTANAFMGLAEGLAAASAGYSSSTTTYNGQSNTHYSASAYGHVGNVYGSIHGYGSSYTTSYGRAHTVSYNGEAAYWASQKAADNMARYSAEQAQIREKLNEGYIQNNTIKNQVEYTGYFNIKYRKVDQLSLLFKIDGEDFPFIL